MATRLGMKNTSPCDSTQVAGRWMMGESGRMSITKPAERRLAMMCLLAANGVSGCSATPPVNAVCEAEKARIEADGNEGERLPLGLAKMTGSKMHGHVMLDGGRMGPGLSISSELEVPGTLNDIGNFYKGEFRRINAKLESPEYYNDLILLHGTTQDGGYLSVGIGISRWSGVPRGSAKVDVHYQADCL